MNEKNTQLFKNINITIILFSIFYIVVFAYLRAPIPIGVCLFGILVLAPLMAILEAKQFHKSARFLLVFTGIFYLYASQIGMKQPLNIEYYYLDSILLPLLLFKTEEKIELILAGITPLIAWCLTVSIGYPNLFPEFSPPENFPYHLFQIINPFCAFLLTGLFMVHYTKYLQAIKNEQIEEIKTMHQKVIHSAKLASLGEMASGIAHEINNPLAIIEGKTHLLFTLLEANPIEKEKLKEGLNLIVRTTDRIAKIIKGLRAFSRNSDHDPFIKSNIRSILEDTLNLCSQRFKDNHVQLDLVVHEDATIKCRPVQISQILMNLIGNAYDAVEKLPEKWVKVDLSSSDNFVNISVTDSGSGIPEDISSKIMLPFFTTKAPNKGSGLGLSISTGIAEEHHGKLVYDSTSPNTRFVLSLPVT